MRTRMSGGVRGVRSNAAPISIIVMPRIVHVLDATDFYWQFLR